MRCRWSCFWICGAEENSEGLVTTADVFCSTTSHKPQNYAVYCNLRQRKSISLFCMRAVWWNIPLNFDALKRRAAKNPTVWPRAQTSTTAVGCELWVSCQTLLNTHKHTHTTEDTHRSFQWLIWTHHHTHTRTHTLKAFIFGKAKRQHGGEEDEERGDNDEMERMESEAKERRVRG